MSFFKKSTINLLAAIRNNNTSYKELNDVQIIEMSLFEKLDRIKKDDKCVEDVA